MLLKQHGIYIQSINYPTVPKCLERLRITRTPFHSDDLIEQLAEALMDVWRQLGLPFKPEARISRASAARKRMLATVH
jgi:5-aminolevulinate synthase